MVSTRRAVPIEARALSKCYGPVKALDNVDLSVKAGEFLTLLGPSGSGKTTLLMVLAGFIRPDHGSLRVGEVEMIRLAPHKRDIGMVFQNYALFPHMDVASNVAYPLKLRGVAPDERRRRVEQALQTVRLDGFGARQIDELSGGQRQRVALARAIVFEPSIVLMDEPLSALDKQLRERMQIELRRLHEQLGTTTIYVTHDQREALTMSDRIAVINGGRIAQLDSPQALYETPANRFVAEFIGESSLLEVQAQGLTCTCAGQVIRLARPAFGSGARWLMLRPERIRILPGNGDGESGLNRLQATVTDLVYQGESYLMQAALVDGTLILTRGTASARTMAALPAPGQPVRLGFRIDESILLDDQAARDDAGH